MTAPARRLRVAGRPVAVAGALAAAVLAVSPGLPSAQAASAGSARPAACPAAVAFVVPGSIQGNAQTYLGAMSRSVTVDLVNDLKPAHVRVDVVQYPAVPVWEGVDNAAGAGFTYLQSRAEGVAALGTDLKDLANNKICSKTREILVGDNQGADVIGEYLQGSVPSEVQGRIAGVGLISDPRFNPKDTKVDAGSFSPSLGGLFGTFAVYTSQTTRAHFGTRPAFGAPYSTETVSGCNAFDVVCNYSFTAGVICFGGVVWPTYSQAISAGIPVLIPFQSPACPNMQYSLSHSLVVAAGKPITTAGIARFLASKI